MHVDVEKLIEMEEDQLRELEDVLEGDRSVHLIKRDRDKAFQVEMEIAYVQRERQRKRWPLP